MTSTTKEREVYYPLTKSELTKLCKLKPVVMKIYLYLKTLDPFGDRFQELDLEDLRQTTGIRSLGSVYPALSQLNSLGLIKWYVAKSYVHVPDHHSDPQITRVILRSPQRSEDQHSDPRITTVKNQEPEPAQGEDSRTPQTNKTNKTDQTDQKNKNAREDLESDPEFEAWIDRGLDSLPNPPQGIYRAKLRRKYLEDSISQKEFLELRAKQCRGSNVPPPPPDVEKFAETEPETYDEYLARLQARMSGGAA